MNDTSSPNPSGVLDLHRLQVPDLVGILFDGAVCREPPPMHRVEDRRLRPLVRVAVRVKICL